MRLLLSDHQTMTILTALHLSSNDNMPLLSEMLNTLIRDFDAGDNTLTVTPNQLVDVHHALKELEETSAYIFKSDMGSNVPPNEDSSRLIDMIAHAKECNLWSDALILDCTAMI